MKKSAKKAIGGSLSKFKRKSWIIPALILIFSIVGLVLTLKKSSFDFKQIYVIPLIFYVVNILLHYLISSLPTPIYISDKRYLSSFLIHRLSLVSGYLFPLKIGIPMKVYLFKKYLGIPISKTSGAIIFESTIFMSFLVFGGFFLGSKKYYTLDVRTFVISCLVIAVILYVFVKHYKKLYKFPWLRKVIDFIINVKNSFLEGLQNIWRVLIIMGISLILTLMLILRTGFLLEAIGQSLHFIQVTRAVLIATFITMLSMVPGGYAVREASLSYFLVQEGVPLEGALIVVFLDRIFTMSASFLLGIVSSLIVMKRSFVSDQLQ